MQTTAKPKPFSPLELFEQRIVAAAVSWSAYVRCGPFESYKAEVATRDEAVAAATDMARARGRAVLIYAVDGDGRQCMVGYVDRALTFVPAMRGAA